MTKREAYNRGHANGIAAVKDCEVYKDDQRAASHNGCECRTLGDLLSTGARIAEQLGIDSVPATTICEHCLTFAAQCAEENARQYSGHAPVLTTGAQWDAYDAGVVSGIVEGVRARLAQQAGGGQ